MDHVHAKRKETNALKRKSLGDRGNVDDEPRKQARPRPSEPIPSAARPQSSKPSIKAEFKPAHKTELWNYIQQFLDTNRGIEQPAPTKSQALLTLPRVRDVEWNPVATSTFKDIELQRVAALILYVVGDMQERPCYRCAEQKGPFKGCVKLPRATSGTCHCSNCWYSHQVCNFEKWVGRKQQRELDGLQEQPDGNATEFESDKQDEDDREDNLLDLTMTDDDDETLGDDFAVLEPILSTPSGPSLYPPISRTSHILYTPSGRRYDEWVDDNGNIVSHAGQLLLPDDYTHSIEDPTRPWACPITDCGGNFLRRKDLRCHFSRIHYGRMLNDNCNGTFTEVGLYDEQKILRGGVFPSKTPSFPVVVSQKPALGQQRRVSSMATPLRQSQRTRPTEEDVTSANEDGEIRPMSEAAILSAMTPEDALRARAMWDYIRPHLASTKTIPANGHVKELLPLPRIRDIKWNQNWHKGFVEKLPRDISCMIIQLTGEEAPEPCTDCIKGKNPFDGCVVIARNADPKVRSHMISCANCNYHGHQNKCSITKWVQEREQSPYPPYHNPKATKAPERTVEKQETASNATPRVDKPDDAFVIVEGGRSLRTRPSAPADRPGVTEPERLRTQDELISAEEWERAPGRIRSEVATEPESQFSPATQPLLALLRFVMLTSRADLAMSEAFLSTSNFVQISHDTYVRVADIRPASVFRFNVEHDSNQHCSLSTGARLKVRVEGEPEFIIGPRGMFKIRPGAKCTVDNLTHGWAAVTVIKQFDD